MLIILYLLFLTFYLCNVVPSISFGDSPELIATSYILSIPHPTGTPLYLIFAKLFSYIPVGCPAFRYNFFSVIFGCLCLVLCFEIFNILSKKRYFYATLCIILGLSKSFYLSSISAEVYTFSLFLFLIITYLLLRNIFECGNVREIYFCFFILGLLLSQSFLATIYLPFFVYLFLQIKDKKNVRVFYISFAFITGLSVYLYILLKIFLQNYEFIRFDNFFDYIFAKGYQEISLDVEKQLITISNLVLDILKHFNIGIIFVICGIIFLFKNNVKLFNAFSLLLIFNLFFSLPASFSFDIHQFLIPTYFVLVVFLLYGIISLSSYHKGIFYGLFFPFLIILIIATNISTTDINSKQKNYYLYNYLEEIKQSAGDNSIIIASNSSTLFSFSLLYSQYVEKSLNPPVIYQMFVRSPAYLNYIKQKYKDVIIPDHAYNLSKLKDEELYFILPHDFFDFYYSRHKGMKFLNTISRNKITQGILNHYRCLKIVESIIIANYKSKNVYLLNLEIYETPGLIFRDKFYLIPKGNLFQLTGKKDTNYQKLDVKNEIGNYLTSLLLYERAKYYNLIDELKEYSRLELIFAKKLNKKIPDNFLYFRGISDSAMEEYTTEIFHP